MRVWDIPAGYLDRGSLLGEHSEIHALASILRHHTRGFARHPETRRWRHRLRALARRHALVVAEMQLRGYRHASPLGTIACDPSWPSVFVTAPAEQYALLRRKYGARSHGRIPLPRTTQELWAQHKYSVMARDPDFYRATGRTVSRLRGTAGFGVLASDLVATLRHPPPAGRLANAVEHMWGHVSRYASADERQAAKTSVHDMLATTQTLAQEIGDPFLLGSTALSELGAHLR